MSQRKNRKARSSDFDRLMKLPWQVSLLVAVLLFCFSRWVIPSMSHTPMFKPMLGMVSTLGQLFALPFALIAIASFMAGRSKKSQLPQSAVQNFPGSAPVSDQKDNKPSASIHSQNKSDVKEAGGNIGWTIELLRKLEWKRFELVCAEYFILLGKLSKVLEKGADGGIDVRVFSEKTNTLELAIQCKAWSNPVGVKEVRELFGVMAHEQAPKGIFMTTSTFTGDAAVFARKNRLKLFLIDGEKFISMIRALPEDKQSRLLSMATEGDYTTPTCASCGIKMVWREKGGFWGCRNYPRCKSTLRIAK